VGRHVAERETGAEASIVAIRKEKRTKTDSPGVLIVSITTGAMAGRSKLCLSV
jgi:hypothetical protein